MPRRASRAGSWGRFVGGTGIGASLIARQRYALETMRPRSIVLVRRGAALLAKGPTSIYTSQTRYFDVAKRRAEGSGELRHDARSSDGRNDGSREQTGGNSSECIETEHRRRTFYRTGDIRPEAAAKILLAPGLRRSPASKSILTQAPFMLGATFSCT